MKVKNTLIVAILFLGSMQPIAAMKRGLKLFGIGAGSFYGAPFLKKHYYRDKLAPKYVQDEAQKAYNAMNPQNTFIQKLKARYLESAGFLKVYEIENLKNPKAAIFGGIFLPKGSFTKNSKKLSPYNKHTISHETGHVAADQTINPYKIIRYVVERYRDSSSEAYTNEIEAQTLANQSLHDRAKKTTDNSEKKELYEAIEFDLSHRINSDYNCPYKYGGHESFMELIKKNPQDKNLQEIYSIYKDELKNKTYYFKDNQIDTLPNNQYYTDIFNQAEIKKLQERYYRVQKEAKSLSNDIEDYDKYIQ